MEARHAALCWTIASVPAGLCVADAAEIVPAYAVATGLPAESLIGMELLVDGAGWLRDRWVSERQTAGDGAALLDHVRAVRSKAVTMPIAHAHAH
ncbi:MAG: hypothetical protein HYR63_01840 [Proteobacteria bacterium]|nr:hypothetical protein [Pseudomonadota bacterium]